NALQAVRSGIWLASGAVTVQNSIVANNNGSHNCAVTGGLLLDNGYNLDNGTSCGFTGTSLSNVDPNLAPLADNGGATQTMSLLPGSPAINGGSDALAVDKSGNPLTNDQRGAGYTRKNGTVDIGALEAVIGTLNVQFTLQGRDGKPVNDPSRVVTAHVRI